MVCISICGLVYAYPDSGGKLEIKTLCGTRLMIGVGLKLKAEERTEKK